MSDSLLHDLLIHYNLEEYEETLYNDAFTIENLLQIKNELDFNGFFEHYDIGSFLHQNRFKTLIAALPAVKKNNKFSSNEIKHQPARATSNSNSMIPFNSGFNNVMNLNSAMQLPNNMYNPMMNPMSQMGQMGFNPMGNMGMNPMMNQMGMNPMMNMNMNPMAAMMNRNLSASTPAPKTKKEKVIAAPKTPATPTNNGSDDNKDDDDEFATEEARDGEQFASIKPWVGTVTATKPDNAPSNNPSAPNVALAMNWIYGFKCTEVRQNIVLDGRGRVIFTAASVLVAYDVNNHTQEHYTGPSDEISCIAQSPVDPNIIAVGQCAGLTDDKKSVDPFITVFDLSKGSSFKLPTKHKRTIVAMSFSNDGSMLVSNGTDDNFTIIVWDLAKKAPIAEDKAVNRTVILSIAFNPKIKDEFVGVGKGTVAFYQNGGGKIKSIQAKFDQGSKDTTFICCAYTEKGTCVVGTKEGSVYYFVGSSCQKVFERVHEGPIHTIFAFPEGYVTSGTGSVKINGPKMDTIATFDTNTGGARSVYLRDKTLVLGTNTCEMYYTSDYASNPKLQLIHTGHCDGELWAVTPHPNASSGIFASVGEDNRIMTWNSNEHRLIKSAVISNEPAAAARKIQRAATSSSFPTNYCARGICWSPNGRHIAIGTNEGKCAVYDATTLSLLAFIDLNSFGKANNKNPEHWIQCLSYSPNGQVLAVGTHGSVIVLLDVNDNYAAKEKLIAHNAAVTCLDWSVDSKNIQSVCLGYELLFHEVVPGLKGSKQEKSASKLKNTQWATQTCKFGWFVNGIFRPGQEGFRIASVDRSFSKDVIATGEDTGKINLFRHPCNSEGNAFVSFGGHASHITCVRFMPNDNSAVSAGGNDKCLIQWDVKRN